MYEFFNIPVVVLYAAFATLYMTDTWGHIRFVVFRNWPREFLSPWDGAVRSTVSVWGCRPGHL